MNVFQDVKAELPDYQSIIIIYPVLEQLHKVSLLLLLKRTYESIDHDPIVRHYHIVQELLRQRMFHLEVEILGVLSDQTT